MLHIYDDTYPYGLRKSANGRQAQVVVFGATGDLSTAQVLTDWMDADDARALCCEWNAEHDSGTVAAEMAAAGLY